MFIHATKAIKIYYKFKLTSYEKYLTTCCAVRLRFDSNKLKKVVNFLFHNLSTLCYLRMTPLIEEIGIRNLGNP